MTKQLLIAAMMASTGLVGAQIAGKKPAGEKPAGEQTFRGVLMDAACGPIARTRQPAASDPQSAAASTETGKTGATSGAASASAHGATGTGPADTSSRSRTVQPEPTHERAGERTRQSAGATSGSDSSSALGTTGAAVIAPEETPETDAGEGERNRTVTTVREKYKECIARPTTTEFALHSGGKLYLFNETSNQLIRKQMRNEAFHGSLADRRGEPQWISVTVVGSVQDGDMLHIQSVRK